MHDFEVGDTVWINEENRNYADVQYGGYYGPFIIVGFDYHKKEHKFVTKLKKPGGPNLDTGAFTYRLKHDVFMHAVKKAVESET